MWVITRVWKNTTQSILQLRYFMSRFQPPPKKTTLLGIFHKKRDFGCLVFVVVFDCRCMRAVLYLTKIFLPLLWISYYILTFDNRWCYIKVQFFWKGHLFWHYWAKTTYWSKQVGCFFPNLWPSHNDLTLTAPSSVELI